MRPTLDLASGQIPVGVGPLAGRFGRDCLVVTAPDIDAVADELYGLPADEFIGARTAYAKQAKADGDKRARRRRSRR